MYKSNKKEVLKKLQDAERRTLEGIGVFVDGESVVRAPVDTGNLRSSINHKVNMDDKSVSIGTPVEYGIWVELGLKSNPNYPKQPFLEPAVMQNKGKIEQIASKLLKI